MSITVAWTSETNIKKVEKPRLPHFFIGLEEITSPSSGKLSW